MKGTHTTIAFSVFFLAQQAYAWDFRLKSEFSRKGTDNVNSSPADQISDTVNVLSAYAQVRDEKNRFRLRIKANRFQKITENDNNIIELSYQRQFSKDLEDLWQLKVSNESYSQVPQIAGDFNFDNRGIEGQLYLANLQPRELTLSGTYLVNIKKYTQLSSRRDVRFDAIWSAEKILKDVLTLTPDFSVGVNRSKDNYYSTNTFGTSLYVGIQWPENVESFISAGFTKIKYTDRTIDPGETLESATSKNVGIGIDYFFNDYISVNGKMSLIDYKSNNELNTYNATEWAFGLNIQY